MDLSSSSGIDHGPFGLDERLTPSGWGVEQARNDQAPVHSRGFVVSDMYVLPEPLYNQG